MKKFLLGIIFCLAVLTYLWKKGWLKDADELWIERTANVVTSVKQIAEFVSMQYYEEFALSSKKRMDAADNDVANAIINFLDNSFINEMTTDELVIIAKGHVRAGFNLANVRPEDVRTDGDTLFLTLPRPEILDATVNPSDFDIFVEDGHWTHAQVQALENRAIAEINRRAMKDGILMKAEQNGIAELTSIYKAFGFKEVVCEVK